MSEPWRDIWPGGSANHRHWFTALWWHLGQHGPQDCHVHSCVQGEPGECDRVIIGEGRDCQGAQTPHRRMTLTEDGPKPRARSAR